MPKRNVVLANNEIYHVYNRAIDRKNVLRLKGDLYRAQIIFWYYRFKAPPVPLSRYLILSKKNLIQYHNLLLDSKKIVDIYCYCLMSNHFHILLKQLETNGISTYLSNIQNSYTRYFNVKNDRKGALFLNQFKAVRIETDEQLIHVSRYIHLNPLTGYLIKETSNLKQYPWSSFPDYFNNDKTERTYNLCSEEEILRFFNNKDDYKKFIINQVEYQRDLAQIKHLTFEDN